MKLLILGHGRHGKDTVAEILNEKFGMTFQSSSQAAADIFLYEKLKNKFGYKTPEECYADRHNHRALWHKEISEYNTPDKSKLAQGIMRDNDIYVGMRCSEELQACINIGLFDYIIWVDAGNRIDYKEGSDSFNIDESFSDYHIDNSGTFEELEQKVYNMYNELMSDKIDKEHLEQTFHAL